MLLHRWRRASRSQAGRASRACAIGRSSEPFQCAGPRVPRADRRCQRPVRHRLQSQGLVARVARPAVGVLQDSDEVEASLLGRRFPYRVSRREFYPETCLAEECLDPAIDTACDRELRLPRIDAGREDRRGRRPGARRCRPDPQRARRARSADRRRPRRDGGSGPRRGPMRCARSPVCRTEATLVRRARGGQVPVLQGCGDLDVGVPRSRLRRCRARPAGLEFLLEHLRGVLQPAVIGLKAGDQHYAERAPGP